MAYLKGAYNDPAGKAFDITPADADLDQVAVGLYVGTAGDLTVILVGDTAAVTFHNAPVGYHPLLVKRVAAATTAAQIVGLA